VGTRGTGERAVSKSGSETSSQFLPRSDYIQRLKAVGLEVRVKLSSLGNEWIDIRDSTTGYRAQVRFFEEPSEFGIDEGRISKLWIADKDDKPVVEYDRGWSVEPPKSGPARELYVGITSLAREPGEGKKAK
jgi:hypothetical protein